MASFALAQALTAAVFFYLGMTYESIRANHRATRLAHEEAREKEIENFTDDFMMRKP